MPLQLQARPMAVARDPTAAEIEHFLVTRKKDDILRLVQSMKTPAAHAALTNAMLLIPPKVATKSPPPTPEKAKKALNAFVGYRCNFHSSVSL